MLLVVRLKHMQHAQACVTDRNRDSLGVFVQHCANCRRVGLTLDLRSRLTDFPSTLTFATTMSRSALLRPVDFLDEGYDLIVEHILSVRQRSEFLQSFRMNRDHVRFRRTFGQSDRGSR